MARRGKSGGGGVLLVLAVILGAIIQAFEAAWLFLRSHGGLIIGLIAIGAGIWIAIKLILWLFRTEKRGPMPTKRTTADSVHAVAMTVQPRVTPATPRREIPPSTVPTPHSSPVTTVAGRSKALPNRWVPPGESVKVHGFDIRDGMVYVGAGGSAPDASQIDPALPIRIVKGKGYETRQTYYWPAYHDITPEARGAYLAWLAAGKGAPDADIGYVFLYFYGLERRVLLDPRSEATRAESHLIEAELRRLLQIYGNNGSFRGYATSLLQFTEARALVEAPRPESPPECERSWHIPFDLRVGLSQCVAEEAPIPGIWAYAWWRAHPEASIRTPAERCPEEFRRLFVERYHQAHGAGLVIKPNKTRLTAVHRPASPSFNGRVFEAKFDLPDVTVISGPMKKFAAIAETCYQTLDRYSRYLGRNPDNAGTIDALLELPTSLWPEDLRESLLKIHGMVSGSGHTLAVRFEKLRTLLPAWQKVTKTSYTAFARSLGNLGLGIEPDPRVAGGCPSDSDTVVLYVDRVETLSMEPSPAYQVAALSLQLAVAVSLADGGIDSGEREVLMRQLESWLHLDPGDRSRLQAHLRWLSLQPPSTNGLKKRIEILPPSARDSLGDFLVRVAHADGSIAPAEVKLLEKLFKMLELEPASLYSKLHLAPTEPVTVRPPAEVTHGFSIPQRPPEMPVAGLDLDFAKVSTLEADSHRVSDILHAIFQDGTQELSAEPDDSVGAECMADTGLWGLSQEYSELLRLLVTRPEWSRAELEELAADRSLMLDGALEHINEAAFDRFDQPFTEGDDPLEINQQLIGEMGL
jgi:tellurite resistance protein